MRLTVKERILLHLLENAQPVNDPEVSPALAQEGVARGAGIERRHLAQFVRPMIREGLVRERQAHVSGIRQRRKVYELTPSGGREAAHLRGKVGRQVIRVRDGDSVRNGSLAEVVRETAGRPSLLEAVRQVQDAGILDLEAARRPPETGLVELTEDAPRLATFVGRRQELSEVLRESGGPCIFVVRGIPGIGKTAFAAKACELVRGRRNLFWHRIRTWETGQTVLAALGRFLEALDRPALASVLKRAEVDLAVEVLRQDLPDTHAFLVLDDAHEAAPDVLSVLRMLVEAAAAAPDLRLVVLTRRALPFYDIRDVRLRGLIEEIELGGLAPEDAVALLAESESPVPLSGLPYSLSGHPLFLELVRSHGSNLPHAVHDMHRFVEEAIYRGLSDSEKEVMKAASLYQVPLSRSALLSFPGSSHDVLQDLEDRALIRAVGSERYEIHDTIRDFMGTILTPQERSQFGGLASVRLRELAGEASAAGDGIAVIAYLSNALRVTDLTGERADLYEALGDADQRIGDVLGMSAAYRESLRLVDEPEPSARLHRKLAMALDDRGYLAASLGEIEAGLAALGSSDSPEVGWLYLTRARVANEDMDWDAAERDAERARVVFEHFHHDAGRVHALLEGGLAASWTGSVSEDGMPESSLRFQAALELSKSVGDPVLMARTHLAMAAAIGYGSRDYEDGMRHYRAVESSAAAMSDPNVGPSLYAQRAWFILRTKRDLAATERDLLASRRLAERVHNAGALGSVEYLSAVVAGEEAEYGHAATLMERAGVAFQGVGQLAMAADAYFRALGFCLAAGDWAGYRRVIPRLRSPPLSHYATNPVQRPAAFCALDALIKGDVDGFEHGFAEIFRALEARPIRSLFHSDRLLWSRFFFSVGLRALGRDSDAERERCRAVEMARSFHGTLSVHIFESDFGGRIALAIRGQMQSTSGHSLTASRSAYARGSPTPSTSRRSSGRPGSPRDT